MIEAIRKYNLDMHRTSTMQSSLIVIKKSNVPAIHVCRSETTPHPLHNLSEVYMQTDSKDYLPCPPNPHLRNPKKAPLRYAWISSR
jgi:hypothetical protein